ncbi:MAG: ABC transporter permease [Candidatus Bathyarchaeia archaeon]
MVSKRIIRYIIIKVLVYLITLFVAFSIVFFFLRLIPGDPVSRFIRLIEQRYSIQLAQVTQEIINEYKRKFGLEGDIVTQYVSYLKRVFLEFDLGPSFLNFPNPVQDLIAWRLPWSIGLLGAATLISWAIGIIAGTLVGWKRGSKIDSIMFTISLCMSQVPFYLLALFLVMFLAYIFTIFPPRWAFSPTVTPGLNLAFISSVIYHATLPSLSLILISSLGWLISTRAITITILGEDYLLFAQAKGLRKIRILSRYLLRNTLLPQTTGLAMSLGFIVNGFYLVEWIFSYPGVGTLLVQAINALDYNTVQGVILISIFTVLTANLIIDLVYPLIDPRVRGE